MALTTCVVVTLACGGTIFIRRAHTRKLRAAEFECYAAMVQALHTMAVFSDNGGYNSLVKFSKFMEMRFIKLGFQSDVAIYLTQHKS